MYDGFLIALTCLKDTKMAFRWISTIGLLALAIDVYCLDTNIVNTDIGTIEGYFQDITILGLKKPVLKFQGIPYAEPPIGSNRFKKPIPRAPFKSKFMATQVAPLCYSRDMQYVNTNNFTEDCLFLDIVVPGSVAADASLPVMVWIHGGGLSGGSTMDYITDALSSYGDVVVVSINYRLGAFGFLKSSDGKLIGNQGLWDQQLALQWLNKHIKNFYGNPNEVTLFGQATGGECVLYQSVYDGNIGLFKRGITAKGSFYWFTDASNAEEIISDTGCNKTTDIDSQIACLRSLPAAQLALVSNNYPFYAVLDGDFFIDHPHSILHGQDPTTKTARNMFASVDLMTGVNNYDGVTELYYWSIDIFKRNIEYMSQFNATMDEVKTLMIPNVVEEYFLQVKNNATKEVLENVIAFAYTNWSSPHDPMYPLKVVVNMTSDYMFFAPVVDIANAHSALRKGNTYFYEFAVNPSNHEFEMPPWLKGSTDGDELPFIFGEPISNVESFYAQGFNYTSEEKLISQSVMAMFTNFAKTGNPNTPITTHLHHNVVWPAYTPDTQSYLRLATPFTYTDVRRRFQADKMALWLQVLPELVRILEKPAKPHFNPSTGLVG